MNLYLLLNPYILLQLYLGWQGYYICQEYLFIIQESYHDSQREIFKVMERRLYNYIMMPAMILSWFWFTINTYLRFFNFFRVMDAN